MFPPERIVCLTEETVETLYLLGEQHRIVGVSGYAVRPARVRKEKPRVSARSNLISCSPSPTCRPTSSPR
jgi:ABC-type hemin transport system substrate-binding protein